MKIEYDTQADAMYTVQSRNLLPVGAIFRSRTAT